MQIVVLVAGVADPKWPLPPTPDAAALTAHASRHPLLSPFDEAALELALQLRDAQPGARIAAVVAGPEALARKVAEWRVDSVQSLAAGEALPCDPLASAQALAASVRPLVQGADLVLVGREFGDWDDGSVPALLAGALALPHVALTLGVALTAGQLQVTRQRGAVLEQVSLAGPALLSVTNDARNRLRRPLMKNVMVARKMPIPTLDHAGASATLRCTGLAPADPPRRASPCRMLTGSLDDQARALAALLRKQEVAA